MRRPWLACAAALSCPAAAVTGQGVTSPEYSGMRVDLASPADLTQGQKPRHSFQEDHAMPSRVLCLATLMTSTATEALA